MCLEMNAFSKMPQRTFTVRSFFFIDFHLSRGYFIVLGCATVTAAATVAVRGVATGATV